MTKPTNLDPVEWAKYNQNQARTLASITGADAPEIDLTPYEVPTPTLVAPRYAYVDGVDEERDARLRADGFTPVRSQYEIEIRTIPTEFAEAARELMRIVNRACCDLEHQGARSSRIQLQLLTALAQFSKETGL